MVDAEHHLYPAGLRLTGRRVVVVGGGHVAQRRLPSLIAAGAAIEVISPVTTPAVEGHARAGDIVWHSRRYAPGDLADAWYVVCATDDRQVNEAVSLEAETRRVFCVRSDDATAATAWTPAVGRHGPLTVAVLGSRDPRRSASVRDEILNRLRSGEIVAHKDRVRRPGVTLVGGGPGDPDLITVAGRRALQEADVVVADRLAPRDLLAELAPDVELVDATKLPRGRAASQEAINELMVGRARAGRNVVRLKGGDPYVFGRGFEEAQACAAAGVEFHVIPGITSAVAVPGLGGIPLTHRGVAHEFTVVSGHLRPGDETSLVDWNALGRMQGTLVLLMAVDNLSWITRALVDSGRDPGTPAAVVQDGSLTSQRAVFSTVAEIASDVVREGLRPPAIVVIGEVVALARSLGAVPA
ncbi:MAG TPA: uroporphyrinogen-III C-methyltransferase [Nocardioidaceae bacterium]|jgi:uroporphyrin-III C-methyltransferase/precorrin-2 dehydrogenase/sirohydrochlorin ferrochelatase